MFHIKNLKLLYSNLDGGFSADILEITFNYNTSINLGNNKSTAFLLYSYNNTPFRNKLNVTYYTK